MKQKQSKQPKKLFTRRFTSIAVMAVLVAFTAAVSIMPNVHVRADEYDEKIKALQQQNSSAQNTLSGLESEASSYQDAIGRLQTQIASLQDAINKNIAEQNRLSGEIQAGKNELEKQKSLLAEDIKTMYVDGEPTTIEMLASSGSLSDFVDKEEYRTAVQQKIQGTLLTIQELQRKLETQKKEVDGLLKDQQDQQTQLASAKSQQDQLLAYNQGQQAAYNEQIKTNKTRISELRTQQSIENARLSGGVVVGGKACDSGNGDTYPASAPNAWGAKWGCSYAIDNTIDNWGMYNRQCVSYTAWKVHESGRNMPNWGGIGNANQWDDNARRSGIPVSTSPKGGDVAVSNSGTYGHVMYVEHVYGDGSILVSDYNQQWDGAYRRYVVARSTIVDRNLQFIHF